MLSLTAAAIFGFFGFFSDSKDTPEHPLEKETYVSSNEINILSATYGGNCNGRRISDTYGLQTDQVITVPTDNVLEKLQKGCNGKKICRFNVGSKIFGDPAPGCRKELTISFRCQTYDLPRQYFSAEQKTATLDCRSEQDKAASAKKRKN